MVLGDGYATLIENVGPAVDAHDIEHETAL
jgi:hypothetical protein